MKDNLVTVAAIAVIIAATIFTINNACTDWLLFKSCSVGTHSIITH